MSRTCMSLSFGDVAASACCSCPRQTSKSTMNDDVVTPPAAPAACSSPVDFAHATRDKPSRARDEIRVCDAIMESSRSLHVEGLAKDALEELDRPRRALDAVVVICFRCSTREDGARRLDA